jgi:hypothetical protein
MHQTIIPATAPDRIEAAHILYERLFAPCQKFFRVSGKQVV